MTKRRPRSDAPPQAPRLVWASSASLVATVVPTLGVLVGYPLLVRALGISGFGLVTFAMGSVSLVGLLESGLGSAVIYMVARELGENSNDETYGATSSVILIMASAVGVLVLWSLAPLLATGLLGSGDEGAGPTIRALRLAALHLPLTLQIFNRVSVLKGHQAFGRASVLIAVNVILTSLVGGWLALANNWSPSQYLAWSLGMECVVVILAILLVYRLAPWGRPTRKAAKDLWRYGARVLVVSASSVLLMQLPRIVGGLAFGPAGAAAIQVGYALPSRTTMMTRAVTEPLMPRLVGVDMALAAGAQRTVRLFAIAIGVATGLGLFVLALVAKPILGAWLGESGVPPGSVLALQIISLGLVVNAVAQPYFFALNAANRPGSNAYASVIGSVVLVAGLAVCWSLEWPGSIASLAISVSAALGVMSAIIISRGMRVVARSSL